MIYKNKMDVFRAETFVQCSYNTSICQMEHLIAKNLLPESINSKHLFKMLFSRLYRDDFLKKIILRFGMGKDLWIIRNRMLFHIASTQTLQT